MTRPPVVVVGLDCPTGLQSARVFAARGVRVIGLAADTKHPCARTRTCQRVVKIDPDSDGLRTTLLRLAWGLGERAVLLPCTDRSVFDIARHKEELSQLYRMAVPSAEVIELLLDKARFATFAAANGFPIPRTYVIGSLADAAAAAVEIGYPCVLKPSVKSTAWSTHTSVKAVRVESRDALVRLYEQYRPWADVFVVQEWIAGMDGDHYTCDCYVSPQGDALTTFCSRKIRQWPPGVGQGCLSVEHRDEFVRDMTLRVLRAAGHHGQGYVEMKRDARSGRYLIVEANVGRPTGRSAAAERAGVELLMTMYCDVLGAPLPAQRVQAFRGAKWIHERRDLQACAHLVVTRQARLRDVVKPWSGRFAFALFSLRDPVPFLADCMKAAGQGLRRRRQPAEPDDPGWGSLGRAAPAVRAPTLARTGMPEPPDEAVVLDVHGILGIQALDARPDDLAAVARELGPTAASRARAPDVVVRFVDDLPSTTIDRVAEGVACGEGGVFFLGRGGEPLAHLTLGGPSGPALIVCRRGLARVPFLSSAVDLAALSHDWIPLHASGWVTRGMGVLAAGCGESGKTGALLAACQRGATPLGDDRILVSADGGSMVGLGQAMSLRERHVAQLALPAAGVGAGRRALARAATLLHRVGASLRPATKRGPRRSTGSAKRLLGRARRRFTVQLSLESLGRAPEAKAPPVLVILLETHERSEVVAERITPETAARRLSANVEAELMSVPLAPPPIVSGINGTGGQVVLRAARAATRLLHEATRGKPCYVVRHNRGCRLEQLHEVIDALLPESLPVVARQSAGTRAPCPLG